MTKRTDLQASKFKARIIELEEILRRIARWETPWEGYVHFNGTRGQEQYIKSLANHGVYGTPIRFEPKRELAPIDHTYLKEMD